MVILPQALGQIKDDLQQLLDPKWIEQTCRDLGYSWRDRTLDPLTTMQLFVQQVLHGNIACSKVRHLADENFSATAYCQARLRLPRELFDQLLARSTSAANEHASAHDDRWRGHRVHHLDGTNFSMPDTPALQKQFGQSGQQASGCGFPVAHVLARFNAATGLLLDVTTSPMRTHDMAKVTDTQAHLQEGDLAIGDCAFCTYAHLALVLQGKRMDCFRTISAVLSILRPAVLILTPIKARENSAKVCRDRVGSKNLGRAIKWSNGSSPPSDRNGSRGKITMRCRIQSSCAKYKPRFASPTGRWFG